MENKPIFLFHWEASYSFEKIHEALLSWKKSEESTKQSLYIAIPQGYLKQAAADLPGLGFVIGANDMLDAAPEAFTGSIAAKLLQECKAEFVLIGSSFKRQKIGESDVSLNQKIGAALENNIAPFVCFCSTGEDPEKGQTVESIEKELKNILSGLTGEEVQRIVFVCDTEPEHMSISQTNPKSIQNAYDKCRQAFTTLWGAETAGRLKTLCAVPPYLPLNKFSSEQSPFAGYYFKMTDTHLPI